MDLGPLFFFAFLGAVILVPQVLRHQERGRLHETLRLAFERGQPVPPELIMALTRGRRDRYDTFAYPAAPGWAPPPAAAAPSAVFPDAAAPSSTAPPITSAPAPAPVFLGPAKRDLRRGVIWLGVGLGLIAAGVACYAGLYEVGGSQETLSLFCAFGSIPVFIGLTYLALWAFERRKTKV